MSKIAEDTVSASVARVLADAARLGLSIEIIRMENARTAEDAAQACGCTVAQIVKSVIFRVEGSDRHVMFLTAGDARVDPVKATALAGAGLAKADSASIRRHTGFAIGGVSPIGHISPIDTWMDPRLHGHSVVWAAAGTPNHVFAIEPAKLRAAADARDAHFTQA